jgi:formylglycine-generating enzyme
MKKLAIAAAILVLLLSSCSAFFSGKPSAARGKGTVSIHVGNGSGGKKNARTIVPDVLGYASTVTATLSNGTTTVGPTAPADFTNGAVDVLNVPAGTWTVTVSARNADAMEIASGSYVGLYVGADAFVPVEITLLPLSTSGTGLINLPVRFSRPVSRIVLSYESNVTTGVTSVPDIVDFLNNDGIYTSTIQVDNLQAGTYSLIMDIRDLSDASLGIFRESVTVYGNLASNLWMDPVSGTLIGTRNFDSAELLVGDAYLSNLSFTGASPNAIPNLQPFSSSTLIYDEGSVVEGSTISFTPQSSYDGQTISYTWNGSGGGRIGNGLASLPLQFASGINTLVINVLSPDGHTTKIYDFTFTYVPSYQVGAGIKMVQVAGGSYAMGGTTAGTPYYPLHTVTVSDFSIGKTEVTQGQYYAMMGTYPATHQTANWPTDQYLPVENVTRQNAMTFCNYLSQAEGFDKVYPEPIDVYTMPDPTKNGYRLPTDAEWEWAAKGGALSKGFVYPGSDTVAEVAYDTDNAAGVTQPVGSLKPNELGLYDMGGNVAEYADDWVNSFSGVAAGYDLRPSKNPITPKRSYNDAGVTADSGTGFDRRSARGGSVSSPAAETVPNFRASYDVMGALGSVGFRVARGARPLLNMVTIPGGKDSSTYVTVPSFQMSETEITQAQFRDMVGNLPGQSNTGDDLPVTGLTWYTVMDFCNRLSLKEGLQPVYAMTILSVDTQIYDATVTADFSKNGYRLPTHTERVWAARGQADFSYPWSSDGNNGLAYSGFAWCTGNAAVDGRPRPVGHANPNNYMLFDMAGNVDEWGWGSDSQYLQTPAIYGGSYATSDFALDFAATTSTPMAAGSMLPHIGFRVVKGATNATPQVLAYANDAANNQILAYSINTATGVPAEINAYAVTASSPAALAVSPNKQYLYSAWAGSQRIYTYLINPGLSGGLTYSSEVATGASPAAMTVDPLGRYVYLLDSGTNSVWCYPINGSGMLEAATAVPTGISPASYPAADLKIGPAGYLYVAHKNPTDGLSSLCIAPINSDGSLGTFVIWSVNNPGANGLAFDPVGGYLLVGESGTSSGYLDVLNAPGDGSISVLGSPYPIPIAAQEGPVFNPKGDFVYFHSGSGAAAISAYMYNSGSIGSPVSYSGLSGTPVFDMYTNHAYSATSNGTTYSFTVFSQDKNTGGLTLVGSPITSFGGLGTISPRQVVLSIMP